MERILLMIAAPAYADAEAALHSARSMALHPERVSIGLSLESEPTPSEWDTMASWGAVQFLCPAYDSWQGVETLWQGEEYVLIGHRAMLFDKGWDELLLRMLKRCQRGATRRALLTGYLPRRQDPLDAVCPVAAESFDSEGLMHFHRGTPLRYAREAQPSAFVHPDFCFGPTEFFLQEEDGPTFLRAYRGQWQPYTLHRPVIRLQWDEPVLPCDVRGYEGGRGLKQFEQKAGVRFDRRQLSAMARQGLISGELRYPVYIPWGVRVQEAIRGAVGRRKTNPLCVTAQLTLPQPPPNLPEEYLGWFENLTRLRQMALLCYADTEHIRRIAPIHPNVLEYKQRYGLPVQAESGADALNLIKLSKPFLLSAAREKFLTHSHYVWVDFGGLRYPVYEHAWLDWDRLCTGRIVLATVNGRPDLSMLAVPEKLLAPLCREIVLYCRAQQQSVGHLPEEEELWTTLLSAHPEWFDVREMPGCRQLITLLFLPRGAEWGTKV